jgi:hypothetical protein
MVRGEHTQKAVLPEKMIIFFCGKTSEKNQDSEYFFYVKKFMEN